MRGWLVSVSMACAALTWPACTSGAGPNDPEPIADAGSGEQGEQREDDRDRDGVCDLVEINELMSDPDRADTDGDSIPDFTEVIASYNPTNPNLPAPDQVAYLSAAPDTVIDVPVRITLDGIGQGYTGEFRAWDALDPRGLTARDFFESAVALGGEPPDNIRGLQSESGRFTSVLGKTRLSFTLRFRMSAAAAEQTARCTIGYPFEYRLKADNGSFAAARDYLLIVVPESTGGEKRSFCVPEACL
jgi:hypothetical protein